MLATRLASPILLLLLAPACVFYAGDDDDCQYGGGEGEPGADYYDPGLRNPDTGECVYLGGGGGGGGECDACGNCPPSATTDEAGAEAPTPTWGTCDSPCSGLDEFTCLATSACRAIYTGGDELTFAECWATDQTGPIQGGSCDGLDATTCSMHDDCSAVHVSGCAAGDGDGSGGADVPVDPCTTVGVFGYCTPERVSCASSDECPGDQECNAETVCLPAPGCSGDAGGDGLQECPDVCYGYCVGGSSDPGSCEGEVTCDEGAPACPPGSTAGIADGCYTGYCIPLEDCDGAPACAEIAEEMSCVERTDCTPIYEGVDCVCDDVDCTCADWVFESCE
jgi:hypothetical protein